MVKVLVIILCFVARPTRELTLQIEEEAQKYCRREGSGLRTTAVFGGSSKGAQVKELRGGVDVVIATPGRCKVCNLAYILLVIILIFMYSGSH